MLSRRSIQNLLDESGHYLTRSQCESFGVKLNRANRDALEAEWELIVLAALNRAGEVEHEPNLGGSTRLDVRFRSPDVRFVADVRTVSDETYDRENPIHELGRELSRFAEKLHEEGIEGGFDFRVNGVNATPSKGEYKTRLIIPDTQKFRHFIFDDCFADFLASIRRQPGQAHHHNVNTLEASVSIVFNPGTLGMRHYTYPSYNLPHDAMRNVVYGALERKSKQIKRAGNREPGEYAGIILCDGACAQLRFVASFGTVSLDQIMATFLRGSQTVDFVCVVDVREEDSLWSSSGMLQFQARVWSRHPAAFDQALEDLFNEALQKLAKPVRTAINTVSHFEWAAGCNQHLYATYKRDTWMKCDSVEISLRAAVNYLAGRIDRTEFERAVHPDWLADMRRRLDRGSGVADVSIASAVGEDDDGLVITFREHDAANASFRTPSSGPKPGDTEG